MRVGDNLPRHRADQPALKKRVPSMPNDDVIDVVTFGKAHNLLRWMAYRDVNVGLEGLARVLRLNSAQHIVIVLARLLKHGLRLNHAAELRRANYRKYVQ